MLCKGLLSEEKTPIYGLHIQRNLDGALYDYIVPDTDKDMKQFLFDKSQFQVDSKSIEIEKIEKNEHLSTSIELFQPLSKKKRKKKNTSQTVHVSESESGLEYGRTLLQQKTTDTIGQKFVRHDFYIRMLNYKLESDKDCFLSETEKTKDNADIIELLPFLQMYIVELASKQGITYKSEHSDSVSEIYSFNFKADNSYYNISTVLGNDTMTSIFKYKKKPKGPIVIWRNQKDRREFLKY